MKKKNKALLILACAGCLIVGSVFGTFAYLTDQEAVKNTFTVGKVAITMDEADVTLNSGERVQKNEYHLIPGHTYIKDPTIYISDDSEDCYLFVKIENGIEVIETSDESKTIAKQMTDRGWVLIDSNKDDIVDTKDNVYVLAKGEDDKKYEYTVSKAAEVEVFVEFTIDGDTVVNGSEAEGESVAAGLYDLSDYESASVVVTAYAVQAAGFDNSIDAWNATFGK